MPTKSFTLSLHDKISSYKKVIKVDSDKSISIRSFLFGAISQNISSIKNVLESDDVFSTIKCLKKLGVQINKKEKKNYLVYGKGLGSLIAKKKTKLDMLHLNRYGNDLLRHAIIDHLGKNPESSKKK